MSDRTFRAGLQAIQTDRSSGAVEIARKCLEIIAEEARHDNSASTGELLQKLHSRALQLARSRPSMAPPTNLLGIFQEDIEKLRHLEPAEAREACGDRARRTIELSIRASRKTSENCADLIGNNKTVFTHSYSSTVLQTLTLLGRENLRVIISEARPLCEGYRLAERLSQLQIPTILITDAQIGLVVQKADIVLVGCDAVLPDFSVVNKAGTYLAALAAKDSNIPFYICGEKFKKVRAKGPIPELEAMDPAEINAPELTGVSVENIYFDITPAKLVTGWINEDGEVPIQTR